MYIHYSLLVLVAILFLWSIWLNINRSKQITALKYSFTSIADFSMNRFGEILSEQYDLGMSSTTLTESAKDCQSHVDYLIQLQQKNGVLKHTQRDTARSLGII